MARLWRDQGRRRSFASFSLVYGRLGLNARDLKEPKALLDERCSLTGPSRSFTSIAVLLLSAVRPIRDAAADVAHPSSQTAADDLTLAERVEVE